MQYANAAGLFGGAAGGTRVQVWALGVRRDCSPAFDESNV